MLKAPSSLDSRVPVEPLLSAISEGVILVDAAGHVAACNDVAAALTGKTRGEILGARFRDLLDFQESELPDGARPPPSGSFTARLAAPQPRRTTRGVPLLRVHLIPLASNEEGFVAILANAGSEELSVERSLAESELRLRLLLDSTGEGIYGVDLAGVCTFANRACLNLLGYDSVDALIGRNMHELIHHTRPDGSPNPAEQCSVYECFRSGAPVHSASDHFWRRDGRPLPIEFWSYPIRQAGDVQGAVVVFKDLRDQHAAAEDRARLLAFVENSSDAIITKSLDGRILTWNKGAEQVYGFTAAEAIGQSIQIVLPEGQRDEEPDLLAVRKSAGVVRQFEATRRRKDGRTIIVSISSASIRKADGEVTGTANIERDVSAWRAREIELNAAKEQAEAANRTKSEFVANISHELRTPMNAILGMIDLARRNPQLPESLHDYMGTAHDAARSMLALVNDLLDFSRLDVGRLELMHIPFSLRETLDEAMRVLALRARDRGLELACHVRHDVPDELEGDPRRLRQIVMNLVGNAIKFTPQGEVIVRATIETMAEGVLQLRLSVSDTGIGIPEKLRERIFEPFTQADASDTRMYAGSGLGLTISRKIAELMGGALWCEANVAGGATFHCLVKFRVRKPKQILPPATADRLRGASVLILEHHQATRDILSEMIAAWGMSPNIPDDAEAAARDLLAVAKEPACDVVLLDVELTDDADAPARDALQQVGRNSRLIMLVPPGELDAGTAIGWDEAGVAAVVEKPISQSALLEAIVRATGDASLVGSATWIAPIDAAARSLDLLVAEDTPANQKVVRAILELRGHVVDIVDNGEAAIEHARRRRYDAILMDIRMPVLGGIEATRQIRSFKDSRLASVPIIALTAHVLQGDRRRCLQAGMNAFITKPIDADELIRSVEIVTASVERSLATALKQPAVRAPAAPPPATPLPTQPAKTAPAVKPTAAGPRPTINLANALRRLGGDEKLLRELAQFFLQDIPPIEFALQQALSTGQADEATRAAHSIKGLAANFDATSLRETAAVIEDFCRTGRLTAARELFDRLQSEVQAVFAELREQLPE